MKQGIYLDNSMAARPSDRAVSSMLAFFTEKWASPSSPHFFGQQLFPEIDESLKNIHSLLHAKDNDAFILTSSGTEAINHVIFSTYFDHTRSTGKNQFITAINEEAAMLMSTSRLDQLGCVSKTVQPNAYGKITPDAIAEAMNPRTALISLSYANGLTGVINPISGIAAICKERAVRLHVDITHAFGKLFYEHEEWIPDFLTFNGEQLHAPKGVGGLLVKQGITCSPFIIGGLEQAGKRGGTLNVPGLIALTHALQEAQEAKDYVCTEVARLRDKFEKGLLSAIPDAIIFFRDQERLPHITAIGFPGIINEALLFALNRRHVYACMGGGSFQQMALLLTACGISEKLARSAISFSLSRETTEHEIDQAIEIISDTYKKMKKYAIS